MSKTCKHNRMTEVLPYLWIGGTKKHTEAAYKGVAYDWTHYVHVVDHAQTSRDLSVTYFACPNYGVPTYSIDYWEWEFAWYESYARQNMATVVTDLGGHGRSGLYCAIIMAHVLGISGQEAIARLRQIHCEQAVETTEQEAYVVRIADELRNWKG